MSYLGFKPSSYRHPFDPYKWTKQTWVWVAAIVLLVLLFAYGIGRHEDTAASDTPAATAKP